MILYLKKLDEIIVVPYESPNKMESMLDYLLYPYHSEIIKNLDDYEFIRDALGKISLKMVFNSNINGDYALDIHTRVNYHHILALIETENGNRFGIFTTRDVKVKSVRVLDDLFDGQPPSDHFPVTAEVEF